MVNDIEPLRFRHRADLLNGRARTSSLWGRDCLAYNLIVRPTIATRADLHGIAKRLADREPQLLCVPGDALHVSVAWLLAVHRKYPRPKDDLWAERSAEWLAKLWAIAQSTSAFEICYRSLVATDSAIIAIAEPAEPVNDLRKRIAAELNLPPESQNTATLVHSTLCRYRGPLINPEPILNILDRCSIAACSQVNALEVSKEVIYPSLKTELVASLPLAADTGTARCP